MRFHTIYSIGIVLQAAYAIDMRDYAPSCGVEPEFRLWYKELLGAFEDPFVTDRATDFFAPGGALIILGTRNIGNREILRARGAMLPTDGSVQWNHFPNRTFVSSETPADKTFEVAGVPEISRPIDSSCATTYFQSHFTVAKNPDTGKANLTPQGGSLIIYDGYSINATSDPCIKGTSSH
ncbi:hypothetical protein HER10_EVM0001922 [Colletotrichum scovillei]|uniref:uncharacterized protein n=1 Tax=Colletotrichum scovillei TaxID=1209932 RepID=UPI0015C3C28E|nr:uncharacterized protein HER10_EVM0001922 [Colletotrichum scovillei]KAF4775920.1 hypothetical protein HER10_EVM0001922 [Colletotrichum scovillei]